MTTLTRQPLIAPSPMPPLRRRRSFGEWTAARASLVVDLFRWR